MMDAERSAWFIEDASALLHAMRTLLLATANGEGEPQASCTPFVVDDGALYVFVSALAPHTANLSARGDTSVMLVRDEAHCADPFARPRLTLRCSVAEVARDSGAWHQVLDRMHARLGATVALVRELPDFSLFRLSPRQGQVVSGFARARALSDSDLAAALRAASGASG